jgi:hypothetical protein
VGTSLITINHISVETARALLVRLAAEIVSEVTVCMSRWRGYFDFKPEVANYQDIAHVTAVLPWNPCTFGADVKLDGRIELGFCATTELANSGAVGTELGFKLSSELARSCRKLGVPSRSQAIASRRLPLPGFEESGLLAEYCETDQLGMRLTMHYQPHAISQQYTLNMLYGCAILEWQ